jgi:putative ABC transport system permease protein
MFHELAHAGRVLRRSPGFTLAAVATLALGIGANTAVFSIVNAVLLRPIPTEALDRLYVLRTDLPSLNLPDTELAPVEVLELGARTDIFEGVTGYRAGERTLTRYGEATRVAVAVTLGDFTSVFRVAPVAGRFHMPDESLADRHRVAVVSHGLWQQLAGGDASFIGSTLELNGLGYEVIGVLPPGFSHPGRTQVWVPFAFTEQWHTNRGSLFMTTVGRVRPGTAEAQLAAHLDAQGQRWQEEHFTGSDFGKVLHATGIIEYTAGPLRLILLVLMGAVVFVLLIAAANVGSLQLVRATARQRELAVRAALGAGRARLVRQLLLESALLAAFGAALGLGIGALALRLFARWAPADQMNLDRIPLDATVLAFTALVALATAIAFGTLPALRATRVQPRESLGQSTRGASAGPAGHGLLKAGVVVQVALALVLLLGSALMIRTLSSLLATDPGFDPAHVTTAQVAIPGASYDTPGRVDAFFRTLLERARALPGVNDAALVFGLPFTRQTDSSPFDIVGRPTQPGEPERHHEARIVSDGYFRTMGTRLLSGREFDGTERPDHPKQVLIDEVFAAQFFPGEDPVGQRILGYAGGEESTIIGVVRRTDREELGSAPKATGYYSLHQLPWYNTRTLVLRSEQPPAAVAGMLRGMTAELDPNVPLFDVQTMSARVNASLGPRRLAMLALGAFGALAVALATIGVYGVTRYSTKQRTREIGIRVAIGAEPNDVVRMILLEGVRLTALGLVVGTGAALALTRFMEGMLFGVQPSDPLAFASAIAGLAAVAILASWIPARGASRGNPVEALRAE